ncbi:Hypothetical protein A7982_07722 [Minicystis rosea]|nr:Hypothetical protein A7982_07722 [Minicystis rosea]
MDTGPDTDAGASSPLAGKIDAPVAVAVDSKGNIFLVGSHDAVEGSGFYVQKLDRSGKRLWERAYGERTSTNALAIRAAMDASGDLVLAGRFSGSGDFGGIPVLAAGAGDAFVLKIDGDGDALWARTFASIAVGSTQKLTAFASGVAVDAQGNVSVVGHVDGYVDFGTEIVDAQTTHGFLVSLAGKDGATRWVRPIEHDQSMKVAADPSGATIIGGGT